MSANGSSKINGKVKFYSRQKGYGFLERPGDSDVFVHARDLPDGVDELLREQRVAFTVEKHVKGPRAKDVEILGPA